MLKKSHESLGKKVKPFECQIEQFFVMLLYLIK